MRSQSKETTDNCMMFLLWWLKAEWFCHPMDWQTESMVLVSFLSTTVDDVFNVSKRYELSGYSSLIMLNLCEGEFWNIEGFLFSDVLWTRDIPYDITLLIILDSYIFYGYEKFMTSPKNFII
jgi:hypothetical protein